MAKPYSEATKKEARELYLAGTPVKEVASRTGASEATVSNWVRGTKRKGLAKVRNAASKTRTRSRFVSRPKAIQGNLSVIRTLVNDHSLNDQQRIRMIQAYLTESV